MAKDLSKYYGENGIHRVPLWRIGGFCLNNTEPKEGKLSHAVSSFFERRENREKVLVKRKKLLLLAVLTGWMGGHRFYLHQYKLGVLYLLFCWTGVPAAMTIIDLMEFIPVPPDENGNVLI